MILPTPPPSIDQNSGLIRVIFTATGQAASDHPALQVSFGVDYAYGATQAAKVATIRTAAYNAYVSWCEGRYTPLPSNQIRSEVVGVT